MTPRLPLLLLGLGVLGACASVPPPEGPPTSSHADRHRIEVAQTTERLDIAVATEDLTLSREARENVGVFAAGYLRYGHGALVLATPAGAANSDAAARATHATRMALAEAGVPYSAVASSSYDAAGDPLAPLVLTFARFEAHAPECTPLWEQDLAHQSNNQPWESFGCSGQANLAALVEDPRDLLRPRTETARDSGRRNTVMDQYRSGQQTHSPRSSDERASVSTVAQ